MIKRKREDFSDEIDEYSAIVKKPKQMGNDMTFDDMCNFFDAIYVGSVFMCFIVPETPVKIITKIKKLVGNMTYDEFISKDWTENNAVINDRILRVLLYLDEYNTYYGIVQQFKKCYGTSIENVRSALNEKHEEKSLFKDMVNCNVSSGTIMSYYLNNIITTPIKWGLEVVTSVNDYFNTCDRKHIDMGDKELCLALLNGPFTHMGLVRKCEKFTDHPPIPVNNKKKWQDFKKRVYIPTPSFYEIEKYDNGDFKFNVDNTNVVHHHITDYKSLNSKETMLISLDGYKIYDDEYISITIDNFKNITAGTKNIVLVFKNNSQLKIYEQLDHVLCKGLLRISSMFKYIIPKSKIDKITCYTHVKKFNN